MFFTVTNTSFRQPCVQQNLESRVRGRERQGSWDGRGIKKRRGKFIAPMRPGKKDTSETVRVDVLGDIGIIPPALLFRPSLMKLSEEFMPNNLQWKGVGLYYI